MRSVTAVDGVRLLSQEKIVWGVKCVGTSFFVARYLVEKLTLFSGHMVSRSSVQMNRPSQATRCCHSFEALRMRCKVVRW